MEKITIGGGCESDLISLLKTITDQSSILLSTDVLDSWESYKDLLDGRMVIPGSIRVKHLSSCEDSRWEILQVGDIYDLLMGEFFSENIMLEANAGVMRIHNDAHANLSVCVLEDPITPEVAQQWDINFCKRVSEIGVGFGQNGKKYLANILENLACQKPQEESRFHYMLKLINTPLSSG
jgi:hypothetical protein